MIYHFRDNSGINVILLRLLRNFRPMQGAGDPLGKTSKIPLAISSLMFYCPTHADEKNMEEVCLL